MMAILIIYGILIMSQLKKGKISHSDKRKHIFYLLKYIFIIGVYLWFVMFFQDRFIMKNHL